MNLQEQISRIQEVMGMVNENIPINVKRRIPVVQQLLNVVLENSYPCDFYDVNHFKEGVIYDIDTFLIGFEMNGMTPDEIKEFILTYLFEDIERYYINASEDC
jgi:hypothetical protein